MVNSHLLYQLSYRGSVRYGARMLIPDDIRAGLYQTHAPMQSLLVTKAVRRRATGDLEVRAGIEPACKDLQSSA